MKLGRFAQSASSVIVDVIYIAGVVYLGAHHHVSEGTISLLLGGYGASRAAVGFRKTDASRAYQQGSQDRMRAVDAPIRDDDDDSDPPTPPPPAVKRWSSVGLEPLPKPAARRRDSRVDDDDDKTKRREFVSPLVLAIQWARNL